MTALQFAVNPTTRLSLASFEQGKETVYAVALLHKTGRGWKIDSDTAVEVKGWGSPEENNYRAVVIATDYVSAVLGKPAPDRFFRDNVITPRRG